MSLNIETIKFSPSFTDQSPGTSGLRKKVKIFKEKHYTESFVQSILNSIGPELKGCKLVLGGDGRYYVKEATELIIKMCAANGVGKIIVGQNGILSTPAASHLIRKNKAIGGIILTASHNPGGPTEDFGIKFNISNGGAAPTNITNKIYEISKTLKEYKLIPNLNCNLEKEGVSIFKIGSNITTEVEVINPVKEYVELMKEIFDFEAIRKLFDGKEYGGKPFKIIIDSMHGVTGSYAKQIFEKELGAPEGSVINGITLEDFGGGHPDPNLTYAKELVDRISKGDQDFGAAFDGDGDRNMILGPKAFFVTPSDSLAILAANLSVIPYFKRNPIKGFARSMPTAAAVDRVGEDLKIPVYETPTGWKFFGNLLDSGKASLCGEESFGTGSDHIREKDGIWAALAWLSVIASKKQSVDQIMTDHWKKYGRNYTLRMDYENVDSSGADKLMSDLEAKITASSFKGTKLGDGPNTYTVKLGDNFSYTDPTDQSVTTKQGLRILMVDGSRIVYRLSGTGSSGATIRVYLEGYESDPNKVHVPRDVILDGLMNIAITVAKIKEYTGRDKPTVIT
ncbi:hypothetical protein O3M35_001916 [Rhynocoris fuscipes]|uniref:phosphoglucomutase (alpha-D-glucose-1,6-bisphosphate-dependent) n=1 Tax=Rhynocoris fuscipes TaxID=488301 RepID=A0AAW1CWZ2_9HEMI